MRDRDGLWGRVFVADTLQILKSIFGIANQPIVDPATATATRIRAARLVCKGRTGSVLNSRQRKVCTNALLSDATSVAIVPIIALVLILVFVFALVVLVVLHQSAPQ